MDTWGRVEAREVGEKFLSWVTQRAEVILLILPPGGGG